MTGLLASEGRRQPRPPNIACTACATPRRSCDTTRWLRAQPCCSQCRHEQAPDAA